MGYPEKYAYWKRRAKAREADLELLERLVFLLGSNDYKKIIKRFKQIKEAPGLHVREDGTWDYDDSYTLPDL